MNEKEFINNKLKKELPLFYNFISYRKNREDYLLLDTSFSFEKLKLKREVRSPISPRILMFGEKIKKE